VQSPPRCRLGPIRNLTERERQMLKPVRTDASYRRLCDEFPALGMAIDPEVGEYEICVHPEGYVYDVKVLTPTSYPALDKAFGIYARRWLYQPLLQDGVPVPFCHPLRMVWRPADDDSSGK
jgi:hypothetical protein